MASSLPSPHLPLTSLQQPHQPHTPHPPQSPQAPQPAPLPFPLDDVDFRFLCLRRLPSLQHDTALWRLLLHGHGTGPDASSPGTTIPRMQPWLRAFNALIARRVWTSRLYKVDRYFCDVRVVHIAGPAPTRLDAIPPTLVVRKRLPLARLDAFVPSCAPVLFVEPAHPSMQNDLQTFVDHLARRGRAGVAFVAGFRLFIFPPCAHARTTLGYTGRGLLARVVEENDDAPEPQSDGET